MAIQKPKNASDMYRLVKKKHDEDAVRLEEYAEAWAEDIITVVEKIAEQGLFTAAITELPAFDGQPPMSWEYKIQLRAVEILKGLGFVVGLDLDRNQEVSSISIDWSQAPNERVTSGIQ